MEVLDGDEVRTNLSKGLGFSKEDRDTNIRRIGLVARLLARNGVFAITAAISPYRDVRDEIRALAARDGVPFIEWVRDRACAAEPTVTEQLGERRDGAREERPDRQDVHRRQSDHGCRRAMPRKRAIAELATALAGVYQTVAGGSNLAEIKSKSREEQQHHQHQGRKHQAEATVLCRFTGVNDAGERRNKHVVVTEPRERSGTPHEYAQFRCLRIDREHSRVR